MYIITYNTCILLHYYCILLHYKWILLHDIGYIIIAYWLYRMTVYVYTIMFF